MISSQLQTLSRIVLVVAAGVTLLWSPGYALANRAKARALVTQGAVHSKDGDQGRALALYQRAIDEDRGYLPAFEAAIPLWIQAGELSQMASEIERATRGNPDWAAGWYALAYAYRKLDRNELAVLAYETYIDLRPADSAPLFGLAMAYKRSGRPEKAATTFSDYVQRESDSDKAAYVMEAQREVEKYRATLRDTVKETTFDGAASEPTVAFLKEPAMSGVPLAQRWLDEHRLASAELAAMRLRTEGRAQRSALWLIRGKVSLLRGAPRSAIQAFHIALGFAPADGEIYRLLGDAYRADGDTTRAAYFAAEAALRTP